MSTEKNRAHKDRKRRKKLRDKLLAEGASEAFIGRALEQMRWDDLVRRHGIDEARRIVHAELPTLDDKGYRPKSPDSLLTGAGRADGMTAKVLKRRETITRFQYRQIVDRESA